MALRAQDRTERDVAKSLGLTITAAQRAAALHRLMQERDLKDPYSPITEPPSDGSTMLTRHLHPRYRFEPLPDHRPEW